MMKILDGFNLANHASLAKLFTKLFLPPTFPAVQYSYQLLMASFKPRQPNMLGCGYFI